MSTSAGIGNVAGNGILTEMAMGFARSRMLCAAARLGLADVLGGEPRTAEELAADVSADPDALYRLLRALASIGIVAETAPRQFILTSLGEPLRKDARNSEWPAVVFWADLLADNWSYLTECVRTGENAARIMEREGVASRWSRDPDARAIFGAVMGTRPAEDYMPLARAFDFSGFRTAADLGGGNGALIAAVLQAWPDLRGVLVDRPEFIEDARLRLGKEGLAARCEVLGADLCQGVPAGADIFMLKHVLHGYGDAAAVEILQNCRSVLPASGRVLVMEFVLPDLVDDADSELEFSLMSDLNMLASTGGKERSGIEWETILNRAGLECRQIVSIAGNPASIIEAALPGQ